MDYSLTILGSSSATPTQDRHHSSFILRFGNHKFMIDCGEGTQNRCIQYDINFQKLEIILVSHLHGDHYLGLLGLINTMNLYSRKKKLTIYSLKGLKEIIDVHFKISEVNLRFELEIIELEEKEQTVLIAPDLKITAYPLEHRIPCLAYKFEEILNVFNLNIEQCNKYDIPVEWYDRLKKGEDYCTESGETMPNSLFTFEKGKPCIYGHISDTRNSHKLIENFMDADMVYHEATFLKNLTERAEETYHSTAEQAAEFAKGTNSGKLVIGHFSSRYKELDAHLEEAAAVFNHTLLAVEGRTISIK